MFLVKFFIWYFVTVISWYSIAKFKDAMYSLGPKFLLIYMCTEYTSVQKVDSLLVNLQDLLKAIGTPLGFRNHLSVSMYRTQGHSQSKNASQ